MTEHGAFLRAICESPDDNTPRLVYADWLDEHGEADRAEFIRVQCGLAGAWKDYSSEHNRLPIDDNSCYANCPGCAHDKKRNDLRRRERELLREDGPLSKEFSRYFSTPEGQGFWIGDVCFHAIFRRGFLEQIAGVSWDVWLKYAGVLLAAQPIRKVRLTTRPTTEPSTRSGYVVGQHSGHFHFYDARDNMLITEFPGIDFELPTP